MFVIKTSRGYYAGPRHFVASKWDATMMTKTSAEAIRNRYSIKGEIIPFEHKELQ